MHVLCCGFLGESSQTLLAPQPVADLAADPVHLCQGGFGQWGVLQGATLHCRSGSRPGTDCELVAGVQIAAFGWEHAVILLENGCIHIRSLPAAEGRDGERAATLASSRALSIPEAATAIAAGEQHSLAATCTGDLYAWGSNSSGQLGCDVSAACQDPRHVALPPIPQAPHQRHRIAQVACGARHSCAVTDGGALLCWGWNLHGQCGVGDVADRMPRPQLVPMPPQLRCKQVSAGLGHTVACFTNGSAYAWGLNNDGQLGLGHDSTCTSPQLVDAAVLEELDVVKAACGARHTVFQTACSKAFSSGWGKYGQLGLGDTRSRNLPEQVAPELGDTVRDVACGWWSTMLLARERRPE